MKFEIRNLKFAMSATALLLLAGCGRPEGPLPADGFVAQAKLDKPAVLIGDPITLTLTARHPVGSTIDFPNIGNGKKIVVRGRSSEDKKLPSELKSETTYQLTSFRIGDWIVTTNPVVCTFSNGTQKAQSLPELVLHVQSSLNATNATKLSDIKEIVKPPLQLSHKLWILLIVSLLALLAGLITLLILHKRKADLPDAPAIPPHILARQALESLKSKVWDPEPFFTELSLILRSYLENRFDLHAPESTTEELTRSMSSDVRLDIKEQQTLRNFMTQADLVKFARADAEKEVMQTAFNTVDEFVEQTKEEPQPEEETK
ncbi:MAG: hypothetical protein PHP93_08965 [Kiritimatiellales bacterium]|nr:hypothetical protein [Kiritimatiellales bacterium]